MAFLILERGFARLDALEMETCILCNRVARNNLIRWYFSIVSRLGDGVAWFVMLLVLPIVFGSSAIGPTLHMSITALIAVMVYKLLKKWLARERPCLSQSQVFALTEPLDRYSFPSGHTMHSIVFIVMLTEYFPHIALLMLPYAISVALSRVVLGLHYPSDVLAGVLLGYSIAHASLYAGVLAGV